MSGAIRLEGSTSGYSALVAPAVAGNQTFTFPAEGGVLATVGPDEPGGSGTGADAWASFNGTGVNGVKPIFAAQNISSITRTATGTYDVVFITPMGSANYSVVSNVYAYTQNFTANGFTIIYKVSGDGAGQDVNPGDFAVFATNAEPPKGTTGADAWGTFNGDGATGAKTPDASYNIASVNKTATGTYAVIFNTPMPTNSYSVTSSYISSTSNKTPTGFTILTYNASAALTDLGDVQFAVFATNAQLPNTVTQEQIESAINNPGCSAWATCTNGPTPTVLGSLNVASVTPLDPVSDQGKYQVTFKTPMPDANYAVTVSSGYASFCDVANQTPNGFLIYTVDTSTATNPDYYFGFAVFATNALPPRGGTGADAWGYMNGNNGNLVNSFNVASTQRTGVGEYLVTFTTAMPGDNYAALATSESSSSISATVRNADRTANSFVIRTSDASGASVDSADVSFVVFATNAQLPDTVTQEQIDQALASRYQQGFFTPVLNTRNGSTLLYQITTATYNDQWNGGWWTRTGNRVDFGGCLRLTDKGSEDGTWLTCVGGMPYTAINTEANGPVPYGISRSALALGGTPAGLTNSLNGNIFIGAMTSGSAGQPGETVEQKQVRLTSWLLSLYNVDTHVTTNVERDQISNIFYIAAFSGSYITDDTTWTPINGATVS